MRPAIMFVLIVLFNISISNAGDLNSYKASCKDIGFKPKTPAFGDCVLELRKRDQVIQSQQTQGSTPPVTNQSKTTENYEAQATEYFRRQQEEFQRRNDEEYAHRLAQYERQKAVYDARVEALEKEKERQKGLNLLELGLRMGAGQSVRDASMATAGMVPIPPSGPAYNAFQPMENYRITTPSGNSINCRYDPNLKRAICY